MALRSDNGPSVMCADQGDEELETAVEGQTHGCLRSGLTESS